MILHDDASRSSKPIIFWMWSAKFESLSFGIVDCCSESSVESNIEPAAQILATFRLFSAPTSSATTLERAMEPIVGPSFRGVWPASFFRLKSHVLRTKAVAASD